MSREKVIFDHKDIPLYAISMGGTTLSSITASFDRDRMQEIVTELNSLCSDRFEAEPFRLKVFDEKIY